MYTMYSLTLSPLRAYISRAFEECNTDEERDRVHRFLGAELRTIFEENRQNSIDWDNYPLPL